MGRIRRILFPTKFEELSLPAVRDLYPLRDAGLEELLFLFVLDGSVRLRADGCDDVDLVAGDSVSVPPGLVHVLADPSDDLSLLEVTVPA